MNIGISYRIGGFYHQNDHKFSDNLEINRLFSKKNAPL